MQDELLKLAHELGITVEKLLADCVELAIPLIRLGSDLEVSTRPLEGSAGSGAPTEPAPPPEGSEPEQG
jgi:hypothetical protein